MRHFLMLTAAVLLGVGAREAPGADPRGGDDPLWALLHEPAVLTELKLSPTQERSFRKLTDELDLRYFPLRNQSPEVANAGAAKLTAEAREALKTLLRPKQSKRLNELRLRRLGNRALADDEVVGRLALSDAQRQRIKEINDAIQSETAALQKEVSDGKPRKPLEKKFNDLQAARQKELADVLAREQRTTLSALLGPPFDLSKLGQPRFKAPEFVDTGEWINSAPVRLESLRGKVVVVHFYAFGCINCVRNYPWYRDWHERFKDEGVVLVGIHTPETASERNLAGVRRKAAEEKFAFPILIDGKNENWKAWGNSMWPCVYLIDKRGYLRDFWAGELKWQGRDGEKYMRERIEGLLAERP